MTFVVSSCNSSRYNHSRKSTARFHIKKKSPRSYATKPTRTKGTSSDIVSLRSAIVSEAMRYIGTRYQYGGKTPKGFDCSGFTSYVLNKTGVHIKGSSRDQASVGKRKSQKDLKAGDLVFFGSGNRVTHVGLVKENRGKELIVVHATTSKGVRTDDINGSSYWRKRFLFGKDVLSSQ